MSKKSLTGTPIFNGFVLLQLALTFLMSSVHSDVLNVVASKTYANTQIVQQRASDSVLVTKILQTLQSVWPISPANNANMHTCDKVTAKLPCNLVALQIMRTFAMLVIVMPMPVPTTRQFGPIYFGKNHRHKIMHNPPAK